MACANAHGRVQRHRVTRKERIRIWQGCKTQGRSLRRGMGAIPCARASPAEKEMLPGYKTVPITREECTNSRVRSEGEGSK